MPYTPPSGHSVVFNFTAGPYAPPGGHSVVFNFGALPTPPAGSGTGAAVVAHTQQEEDFLYYGVRRPAGLATPPAPVPATMRRPVDLWAFEEAPWINAPRRFAPIEPVPATPTGALRRAVPELDQAWDYYANAAWAQAGIRGAAPGPLEYSKLELGAWVGPPQTEAAWSKIELGAWTLPPNNRMSFSKLETGLWLAPTDHLVFSKVEVGLWLVPGTSRRPHLLFSAL